MFILSQNKDKLVELNNLVIATSKTGYYENYSDVITIQNNSTELGIYKSVERCKEIIKEIQKIYENNYNLTTGAVKPIVYDMPKE